MSAPFSRVRRLGIACAALAIAAACFRSQVACALVVRGDDFMYRNNVQQAMARYERAMTIDADNAAAADRLVFANLEERTPESLQRGVRIATRYLSRHPNEANVLADRALCFLAQRDYALAEVDFERAATALRDPRYFTFAGWAARRANRPAPARALWKRALAIDPRFKPARIALERFR